MRRFREKLYRFMYGRYGTDSLYRFLLILSLLLLFAEVIVGWLPESAGKRIAGLVLSALVLGIYAWSVFRAMSRNVYKRRRENEAYLKASRAVKRFFNGNTASCGSIRDDAYHIFRNCTRCGATLRLPRRVGKHSVKCPKCGHGFYVRSK